MLATWQHACELGLVTGVCAQLGLHGDHGDLLSFRRRCRDYSKHHGGSLSYRGQIHCFDPLYLNLSMI